MKHPEAGPPVEWDVVIDQLRAQTRIGIHNHERVAQPVLIDAVLHCRSQALPEEISECLDYDAFCRMLCAYLDAQTHTDLVEQLAADLLALGASLGLRAETVQNEVEAVQAAVQRLRGGGPALLIVAVGAA